MSVIQEKATLCLKLYYFGLFIMKRRLDYRTLNLPKSGPSSYGILSRSVENRVCYCSGLFTLSSIFLVSELETKQKLIVWNYYLRGIPGFEGRFLMPAFNRKFFFTKMCKILFVYFHLVAKLFPVFQIATTVNVLANRANGERMSKLW